MRIRALITILAASLGVATAMLVAGCGERRPAGTGTGHGATTPTSSTSPTTSTGS